MTQKHGWRDAMVCLVLALGVIAIYFPAFGFNFVNLDDPVYVVGNPHVNKGLAGVWGWAFQIGYAGVWQPLTWISHAFDWQIYGPKAGGHHATGVLLHALNSALVFLVLRRLTGAFWRSAAVAAFFAWHPLHVEAVAWISERKGLLCAFFWLLAVWSYVRYAENLKSKISSFKFFYAAALLLFALALMSKPVALTLPCVLLLLDWWPLGRLAATGAPGERTTARKAVSLLLEKIPFFALSAASIVVSVIALRRAGGLVAESQLPLTVRFATAVLSYFRFLAKTFWPSDLGAMNPTMLLHTRWELVGVAAVLAAISILALCARKERPYWLVGWLWFLVVLLPTMNLAQTGDQPMGDRNMYIPSIGLWLLICWEACDLAGRWRSGRIVLGGLCALLLVACAVASSAQLRYWKNETTLLARIPLSDSNFGAHTMYARYLMYHGQLANAESECRKAVAIFPASPALPELLGEILLGEHKYDPSIEQLRRSLHLQPNRVPAHMLLGRALLAKKLPEQAADEFRAALHYAPKDFEAHNGLARTLLFRGKTADAITEFHASLALQPNQPETMNDLAWLLATDPRPEIRHGTEAVQLAARACDLTRGQAPSLIGTLAAAFAETGAFDKAIAMGQKAHDLAVKQAKEATAQAALASAGQKERDLAVAQNLTALAERNVELLKLYRARKPVRETPPPQ